MDARRRRTAAGVMAGVLGCSVADVSGTDERPQVALHIKNHADVPQADRARAQTEVERIFGEADVDVAWVDEDEPRRIAILLLSLTRDSQEDAAGCALGLALVSQSTAYVFVNRIVRATRGRPVDLPLVLGRVIAHEIGHLLLPQTPHSRFGIMRADLDFGYTNPTRFSDDDVRRIQSALRAPPNR